MNTIKSAIPLLRDKYPSRAFAFLEQVGNGTAHKCNGWADAIVVSLWPSRGLEIMGFEVKASRADWKRELANPSKAENQQRYCHRWYVVAENDSVVSIDEVPATWGLMVVRKGRLKTVKEAPVQTPQPVTLDFLAAVLRRASEQSNTERELRAAYTRGADDERQKRIAESDRRAADIRALCERRAAHLQASIDLFREESGVDISSESADYVRRLAQAVRLSNSDGWPRIRNNILNAQATAQVLIEASKRALEALDGLRAPEGEGCRGQ